MSPDQGESEAAQETLEESRPAAWTAGTTRRGPRAAFRRLPRPVRWLVLLILAAAVVTVLFTEVFPRVERFIDNPVLDGARLGGTATAA